MAHANEHRDEEHPTMTATIEPVRLRDEQVMPVSHMLARADAAGVPCYLETAKERNVAFYRAHGFDVLVEDTIPNAFRYWTMRRPPRG
jgi:hypothetical protein